MSTNNSARYGADLLRSYITDKQGSPGTTADGSEATTSIDGTFSSAVAAGSSLAQSYSNEKRKYNSPLIRESQSSSATNKKDDNIGMIRKVMSELQSITTKDDARSIQDKIPQLSVLLQGIEENLTASLNTSIDQNTSYYPRSRFTFSSPSGTNDDNILNYSNTQTPRGGNNVLKTFMKNQLDLQEAEWEGYEEMVNSLVEQLDGKQNECIELQESRDHYKEKSEELEKKLHAAEAAVAIETKRVHELERQLATQRSKAHSDYSILEKEYQCLQSDFEENKSELRQLEETVESYRNLQQRIEDSTSTGDENTRVEELTSIVEDLKGEVFFKDTIIQSRGVELEGKQSEIEKLQAELSELQDRLQRGSQLSSSTSNGNGSSSEGDQDGLRKIKNFEFGSRVQSPMKGGRLSDVESLKSEAKIEQLTSQLAQCQQEQEAMRKSLEDRLSHKSQRAEELVQEVGKYRALLTAKSDELDAMNGQNLKEMAKIKTKVLNLERDNNSFQAMIKNYEDSKEELESVLQEKENEILREKQNNEWLKEMMENRSVNNVYQSDYNDSDQSAYGNTQQLQNELSTLRSKYNEAQTTIVSLRKAERQQSHSDNSNLMSEFSVMEQSKKYQDRAENAERELRVIEKERAELEEEIITLRSGLLAGGDAQSSIAVIRSKLEKEKNKLESQLQQQKEKIEVLENTVDQRNQDLAIVTEELRTVAKLTLQARQLLANQEDDLITNVTSWMTYFDDKLSAATWALQQVSSHSAPLQSAESSPLLHRQELIDSDRDPLHHLSPIQKVQNHSLVLTGERGGSGDGKFKTPVGNTSSSSINWELEREYRNVREELERQLSETKLALHNALLRADRASASENRALQELRDARRSLEQQSVGNVPLTLRNKDENITLDDLPRLVEKLENAERRCVEISAQRAKAFAHSARSIAYLEGESSRLKLLVDHLRIVNAKLMGDVTAAQKDGIQSKSLEHRLKITLQQITEEKQRYLNIEQQLRNKEREMLALLNSAQDREEQRVEQYEHEIKGLNSKLRISQDKIMVLTKEVEVSHLEYNEMLKKFDMEISALKQRQNVLENDLENEKTKNNEAENMLQNYRNTINQKESQLNELNEISVQQQNRHRLKLEEWQKKREALENDSREKGTHIIMLEGQLANLKTQLERLEDNLSQEENHVAATDARIQEADEENRKIKLQLTTLTMEMNNLNNLREEQDAHLVRLQRECEAFRLKSEEQEIIIKQNNAKILKGEDKIRELLMAHEASEHKLLNTTEEQTSLRNVLSETEVKIQELSDQLNYTRVALQASENEVHGLHDDNANLRKHSDDTSRELNSTIRKNNALTTQVNELLEELSVLRSNQTDSTEMLRNKESALLDLGAMMLLLTKEGKGFLSQLSQRNKSKEDILASPQASKGYDYDDDVVIKESPANTARYCSEVLSQLRILFDHLKDKTETSCTQNFSLHDTLQKLRAELMEAKQHEDQSEQKSRVLLIERDNLLRRCDANQDELIVLRDTIASLTNDKENSLLINEEQAQRLRTIRRELQSALSSEANNNRNISLKSPSSGNYDEIGTSLSTLVRDVESMYPLLIARVETLYNDDMTKKIALERLHGDIAEKERAWAAEKQTLLEKLTAMASTIDEEHTQNMQARNELQAILVECDELRQSMAQGSRINGELEAELRAASDNNNELRNALQEAEALVLDLRNRIKNLQQEAELRSDELNAFRDQMDNIRRRSAELELELEKTGSTLGRIRAEKEGLDSIRKSLETELDNCRAEMSAMTHRTEDSGTTFELERLLSVLGGTIDHLSTVFAPSKHQYEGKDSDIRSLEFSTSMLNKLKAVDGDLASSRVEGAIKKLNELRNWSRDEKRYRKVLEERCEALERDLAVSLATSQDIQRDLKRCTQEVSEKDREIQHQNHEHNEMVNELNHRQEEIQKLHSELSSLSSILEEERRGRGRVSSDNQQKDVELANLRHELESYTSQHTRLQEQVSSLKEQLTEAKSEIEVKNEQLRASKATISRLNENVDRLDKGVDRGRKEREELEARLQDIDALSNQLSKYKIQTTELTSRLSKSEELRKALSDAKNLLEERFENFRHDNDEDKRKIQMIESKFDSLTREHSVADRDLKELRVELVKTRERLEFEYASRMKAEHAYDALKRTSEELKDQANTAAGNRDEIEDRYTQVELDNKNMRELLNSLRISNDEKEVLLQSETEARRRAEQELHTRTLALDRQQRELAKLTARSSSLRTECRRARRLIMDATSQIRELVNVVRSDALASGVDLAITENKTVGRGRDRNNVPSSSESLGGMTMADDAEDTEFVGGDPLGMLELTNALDSIRGVLAWIQEIPRERMDLEAQVRRLETENNRLAKDIKNIEALHEDMMSTLRSENQQLERQINELRKGDSRSSQLGTVERTLIQEREARERSVAENRELKKQIDALNVELLAARRSKTDVNTLVSAGELDHLRREVSSLKQEVRAVSHHRGVLREAIDQLEGQLKRKFDTTLQVPYSDSSVGSYGHTQSPGGFSGAGGVDPKQQLDDSMTSGKAPERSSDDDMLRKQVARFRARSAAMDALVSIYRAGLIALYPDGSSYGATQMLALDRSGRSGGITIGGWAESEVALIRRSFEEEVRLLETEVEELRGRLKQGASYIAELRRRLEESLRANYKSGKGQLSEALSKQLEHMSSNLETAHAESRKLAQELAAEKTTSRKRHTGLVEELAKCSQLRDAALVAVKRLEAICIENNIDHMGAYQNIQKELFQQQQQQSSRPADRQSTDNYNLRESLDTKLRLSSSTEPFPSSTAAAASSSSRRSYLEADEELEAERRARRRARAASGSSGVTPTPVPLYSSSVSDARRPVSGSTSGNGGGGPPLVSSRRSGGAVLADPLPPPPGSGASTTQLQYSTPVSSSRSSSAMAGGSLRVARTNETSSEAVAAGGGAGGGSGKVRGTTKILLHRTGVVDVESVSIPTGGNAATTTSTSGLVPPRSRPSFDQLGASEGNTSSSVNALLQSIDIATKGSGNSAAMRPPPARSSSRTRGGGTDREG